MQLVPVNIESIQIGQPLPFSLMDKDGVLLAHKSFVVGSRSDLIVISNRGGGLFIDVSDSESHHRAYVDQLNTMVRQGRSLGDIADTKISVKTQGNRQTDDNETPDWLDLQVQANTLLRDTQSGFFMDRLDRLCQQLDTHSRRNPDGTLFALIYLSTTEVRMYSATHAMLVSVMCSLAAREVLKWPADQEQLLCKAALTMNLGMTELQDRLAVQTEPISPSQRKLIDEHPARSMEKLMALGVTDSVWLQAVAQHHTQAPGPLQKRAPAERFARLIQRADMFAARLAPRSSRTPVAPAVAMQACYFDETRQIDEAGAALIKTVGIYQPGAFVRLATDEVGIVVRRGSNTATPKVAVLINRSGMPTGEPMVRDTSQAEFKIAASVPHREVRVQINLERLLPLTISTSSDRPW
jgi:HD-GYP domain-containing protein (c-di-GMP phosphodiesterase class II)